MVSPDILLILYSLLLAGLFVLSIVSCVICICSPTKENNQRKLWTVPLFCSASFFIIQIGCTPWYMKEYVLPMTNLDSTDLELLQLYNSGLVEPLRAHCRKHNRVTWLAKSAVMRVTPAWLMKSSHGSLESLKIVPMSTSLFGMRGGICVRSFLDMPHVQEKMSGLLACHLRGDVEFMNLRRDPRESQLVKNPGRNLDNKFCNKMFNVVADEIINGRDYQKLLGVFYMLFYGQIFWRTVGALLDSNVRKVIDKRLLMHKKGYSHLASQMWGAITFNQNAKREVEERPSQKKKGSHSFPQKLARSAKAVRFLSRSHLSGTGNHLLGVDVAADGILEGVPIENGD